MTMISIPIHSMMKTIRRQRMKYVFCEYTNKKNLYDVCRDVANYRDVLFNKYNYKLMSSVDMKGNHWLHSVVMALSVLLFVQTVRRLRIPPSVNGFKLIKYCFKFHDFIASIACRVKESKKVKKAMDEMKHSDDEEESRFMSRGW
eukprot:240319_1